MGSRIARLAARHMGKYMPGNPQIIVQNMPGAGSLRAVNYLYKVAPKAEQRHCVYQWAHKNHLTLVIINAVNDPMQPGPKS